jgi:hypothetical protein
VVPIPAEINSVEPDSLELNRGCPFIVRGVFKPGAIIVVNDIALRRPSEESALEATLPGNLEATDSANIRVEQEGIQSLDTICSIAPTTGPFIFNVAPILIRHMENKPSI